MWCAQPGSGTPFSDSARVMTTPATTKAERRAKQEKQRADKAAKAAAGSNKVNGAQSIPSPSSSVVQQQRKGAKVAQASKQPPASKDVPPAANVAVHPFEPETRGLRIFSHFGLPKHTEPHLKGPLHPAIFRLALQFSEFRIVGANARCIATLNAFKMARSFSRLA